MATFPAKDFTHVKVGDTVTRDFFGSHQRWQVTAVDEKLITIGMGWQFERKNGWEYDPDLGYGSEFGATCSRLI